MTDIIHPFNGKHIKVSADFCGKELTLETGEVAFLADGAVMLTYGETVIMATAVISSEVREGIDFFPLLIDYEEKMYATGKISGSRFIKREGRPSDQATLAARLIDRPIRPLWPKGFRNDVQCVATVLSSDMEHRTEVLAMIAASAALMLTGGPFQGPIAGINVSLDGDKLVPMPDEKLAEDNALDLTVAGTADAIMMVEAGANEVSEEKMVEALDLAHKSLQPVIELQNQLVEKVGVETREFEMPEENKELTKEIDKFLEGKLGEKIRSTSTSESSTYIKTLESQAVKAIATEDGPATKAVKEAFDSAIKKEVRRAILEENARPDERKPEDVRPLSSRVGILPRVHGSALFTRGSTQVLNVTTLASPSYAQLIDTMEEDTTKHFMHHYNFPAYSVGEASPMRSPGRREIGHGALAERALEPVIPRVEDFPYTIRTVSEVTTSNGSTSMASVCGATLSLMDAGVPIRKPVAGIAMGLMSDPENGKHVVLSDIAGAEDFAGDMDFKVAGTKDGITALQMDIKVKGITPEIMAKALEQAKTGRNHIMEHMLSVLPEPRSDVSKNAPKMLKMQINPDKIRDVIGKGGETINKIIEETGVEIDIEDDGLVIISAPPKSDSDKAIEIIKGLTEDPEVGKVYEGKVVTVKDFGAFVQIMPGKDGLVHISELADGHVGEVTDIVKEGDIIKVKLTGIDEKGRLQLSKRAADEA